MSILGNRVVRKEDPKFLTTGGTYVDDLDLAGAVHLTFVRSTMAHARIASLDVEGARRAPGVVAVYTAADVDLEPLKPDMGMLNQAMVRQWLATDTVRFVGEPLVAVLTEERYQGEDAAEQVMVDYEPLPAVVDQGGSKSNATTLFPDAGTNVVFEMNFGRDESLFDGCDVVVRQRIVNQRVAPCPLEVRAAVCVWEPDGTLRHWASTQTPHSVRDNLARIYGLDPSAVHLVAPDVGGGFGAKIGDYPDELILPWLARAAGRPVKWVETRSESMLNLGHGRGQVQEVELGGNRDGSVLAYRLGVVQDAGAYPRMGAVLPFMTRTMLTGVYAIPRAEFSSCSVVTNTTPTVAYRGAGRPEAAAAIERTMDVFACEIGMDPAEVRRRNLVAPDAFPFTTPTGTVYDSGNYRGALDKVLDAAGYDDLRREQQTRRASGDPVQMGIGISVYVEITGGAGNGEYASVEVLPNGKVVARTGTSPHGQGHVTAWSMLIADKLGIDLQDIEVIHGDTDLVPRGVGTMGSRSLQQGGVAVNQAAAQVAEEARAIAADLLEASVEDVVLDTAAGQFHVAGTPAVSKNWSEVATAAGERAAESGPGQAPAPATNVGRAWSGAQLVTAGYSGGYRPGAGLLVEVDSTAEGATFPFGAHVAVVDVDTETGRVTLRRLVAVDDAGRILNPLLAEGQVHGGLAQGAAQALLEEVRYDEDGNPVTANLADYAFISATDLPSFETVSMETPTPRNELGAKGIGESGTVGSTPAVQNAVIDAVAHLGVRHVDMPCTAERVRRAIQDASNS